ncbi:DinB family protein [Aquimarina sp. BL5]|uniref:DinB family protein n=1 Tax=Aquimarina sp. BL5 TaxID=1714860 RepID=UPI000E51EF7F|nr:DinB family protein [Aquimarina sp. BL5]AXT51788.1 DinB family protein [Aquimarina sp. BL5]RKN11810.1 DinB family protein [Aquimarina sp. BL5]
MKDQLEITKTNRRLLTKIMDKYSLEDLNKVPEGFSNNLIWNIAHVVVTQQLLVYKLSGLPLIIDDEMIDLYKKGTKTERVVSQEEVDTIKELLFSTLDKTEEDINSGIFKEYQEYPTSTGFVLKSVKDAINFNNFHEGIHLGYILALKKSL